MNFGSRRQTPDEWDQTIVGWQLEDFHLHLPQFITTFSTQTKRAFDSFVKTFAVFLTTNNQTNPQTSPRVQISLSPPPRPFNNKLRLWHLFTTENREWFPLPFWEFVHFFFVSIDAPWQLLLFLLLDPINLLSRARERPKTKELETSCWHGAQYHNVLLLLLLCKCTGIV